MERDTTRQCSANDSMAGRIRNPLLLLRFVSFLFLPLPSSPAPRSFHRLFEKYRIPISYCAIRISVSHHFFSFPFFACSPFSHPLPIFFSVSPFHASIVSYIQDPSSVQIPAAAPTDEASAMAAMFAATNSQWQQTQEQMAK